MKYTFENIYVNKIDCEKLAQSLQENFNEPISIKTFGGLILKPKAALIDTEIVSHGLNKDGTFTIDIFPADKENEDGSRSISIFPKWTVKLTPDELKEFVTESMPVSEYVKDRRGYNSRLQRNEVEVTKWFNQKEKA